MSLLWRDRYTAVICPDKVTLVRRRRGWRGKLDFKADATVAGEPTAPNLAAALGSVLKRSEVAAGELVVILSNALVRYQLVPWNEAIGSPDELQAFARVGFEQTYGNEASKWTVVVAPAAARRSRLAAAIDEELLAGLRRIAGESRLRLRSIQPYLVAAFNRLGRGIRAQDFLFVVAEPLRTCLLAASRGGWKAVRTATGGASPDAIAGAIERELLLAAGEGQPRAVFVHAPQHARLSLPTIAGVNPVTLSVSVPASLSALADPQLAMAMTTT